MKKSIIYSIADANYGSAVILTLLTNRRKLKW